MFDRSWHAAAAAALFAGFAAPVAHAQASTLTTLHAFCAKQNCPDGSAPQSGLASDSAGNVYGTTS